jgi:hypothetical protein
MNKIELLGYVAAAVTFIGFMSKNIMRIRFFSLLACAFWIAYGALKLSGSIILCNSMIGVLQLFKIVDDSIKKRDEELTWCVEYKLGLEKMMSEPYFDWSIEHEYKVIVMEIKKIKSTKYFFYSIFNNIFVK